jgi:hypothetical protein
MIKVAAACLAVMLMCSGCIELLALTCDDDDSDCFAGAATPPAPLASQPVDMAR